MQIYIVMGSFGETVFIKMNNSEKQYILGISAYEKIARELPKWKKKYSEEDYRKALISFTEYMGKVPKVPNQIMGMKETDIPYYANYEKHIKVHKSLPL